MIEKAKIKHDCSQVGKILNNFINLWDIINEKLVEQLKNLVVYVNDNTNKKND